MSPKPARTLEPDADSDLLGLFSVLGAAVFRVELPSLSLHFEAMPLRTVPALGGVESSCTLESLLLPDDVTALSALFQAVSQDGVARTLEHRTRTASGSNTWVRTSVMRGRRGLAGAMLDITSSRHNEKQWREIEAWLVALGEALPFDFWICDREGRFVLQNPASMAHLGNRLGLPGESSAAHDEAKERWTRAFDRALEGETVREELSETREGVRVHLVRLLAPVRETEGVHGVLGVDLDVSELKEIEEKLRNSLAELRLAQDALVRKSQLAAVGEMAAVVAHEVRNPLASIGNVLALLRRTQLGAGNRDLLAIIEEESGRIEWLVANLLEFVRPMVASLDAKALTPLIHSAVADTLRTEHAENYVEVQLTLDRTVPPLWVDSDLFRLALSNILRNAVQAMQGRGRLHISLTQEDGRWAVLRVRDSGPGIAPENLARLFEPFFTTRSTGSGLGLPIVQRVMHEHHGDISLSSVKGEGALCVLRLPLPQPGGES